MPKPPPVRRRNVGRKMPERVTLPDDSSLESWLDAWEASGSELPSSPLGEDGGGTGFADFARAVEDARTAASRVPVGRVPGAWLAAYSVAEPERAQDELGSQSDFSSWLILRTGRAAEVLTERLRERFLRLRQPVAAFTTQQTDETILPETPVGSDASTSAAIFKRSGRLLLRLQSQKAALQNEIVAVLLPLLAGFPHKSGLFFVAMAATGVGDWSVGWAQISEAERDAVLREANAKDAREESLVLRPVRLSDSHARLLPLLSLAAAEDAHMGLDPLARSVWMEWMERWRREMQNDSAS